MYKNDIDTLIPGVYIHEDISETKYNLITYYGGSIVEVWTAVMALIVSDINNRTFKSWWPNDEEILEHFDRHMSHVHNSLYNAWAIKSVSGNDERRITWEVIEPIYRKFIVRLWRRFLNVAWQSVVHCFNVAMAETGNRTNKFSISFVGIAVDEPNALFIARYHIEEYI